MLRTRAAALRIRRRALLDEWRRRELRNFRVAHAVDERASVWNVVSQRRDRADDEDPAPLEAAGEVLEQQ